MQEGCSKLHTCIISTRSVLSHMEKHCLLRTKESMDPKSGCQTCYKTAQKYEQRKKEKKKKKASKQTNKTQRTQIHIVTSLTSCNEPTNTSIRSQVFPQQ